MNIIFKEILRDPLFRAAGGLAAYSSSHQMRCSNIYIPNTINSLTDTCMSQEL